MNILVLGFGFGIGGRLLLSKSLVREEIGRVGERWELWYNKKSQALMNGYVFM